MRNLCHSIFYATTALVCIAVTVAMVVSLSQHYPTPAQPDVTAFDEQVRDRDLLTPQEKEWARESGVGSYWFDGMYYVDEGLPSVYWEE